MAWRLLDHELNLASTLKLGKTVTLSAETIRLITHREPRLMMKFDSRAQRPSVIKQATILPIANGEYLIIPGDGYHTWEEGGAPTSWVLPNDATQLRSLPWKTGPASESQLIDMVLASGALHRFLNEDDLFLTIRGRLRSPSFDFTFDTGKEIVPVEVSGVQVEVDAGLEGAHINLIEAKMGAQSDFHVRQLYYPVRMWGERVTSKTSRAVFLNYADKVVSLRLYDFITLHNYSSLRLIKSVDLVFEPPEIRQRLSDVLERTTITNPPAGVTFPQADDMRKVMDIVDATAVGITSAEELMERYQFTSRQANYYPTAARYLGLLDHLRATKVLTEEGMRFARGSRSERHGMILEALAQLPVFRDALEHAIAHGGELPGTATVSEWIAREAPLAGQSISGSTITRRAGTVRGWTRWAVQTADL